jgi:hypothetical protein
VSDPVPQPAFDPSVLRTLLYDKPDLRRVAYTAAETAAALNVSPQRVHRHIATGEPPTRNTGKRYLVSGAIILDVLGRPHPDINDPRTVIEPDAWHVLSELATLLGVPYQVAHRLAQNQAVHSARRGAGRPLFLGAAVLAYLAGADEPIRYGTSSTPRAI